VPNRLTDAVASGTRQIISVLMIFFGSVLATNMSAGPCGGTPLSVEPLPAIFIAGLGLELILCSYFLVKTLKVESSFRVAVYLFLLMWSLTVFVPAIDVARSGLPAAGRDLDDSMFYLLRGFAAVINLVVFYRWVGVRKMITSVW
jgi:hypothetical protein